MRVLALIVVVMLAGCATSKQAETRDPYPVEPQTVTVHFLDEDEWNDWTQHRTMNGSWWMPGQIDGSAKLDTDDDGNIVGCDIYFPAGEAPSRYMMSHELRHCTEGDFH